jgi:endonuclease YncB( thermonuclease family)
MLGGRGGFVAPGWLLAGLAFGLVFVAIAEAQVKQGAMNVCAPQVIGTATVSKVLDGRSFVLDDGREVRLPNIEVPVMSRSGESEGQLRTGSEIQGRAARAARAALDGMLAGKSVELRQSRSASDRYGRMIADAFLPHTSRSAAQEMLVRGFARASGQTAPPGCAAEFLASERTARRDRLGLWGEAYYAVIRADDLSELLAHRGHFALVEGKVLSVRESAAVIYINFGHRWSDALTVTIGKRSERSLVAAGLNLRKMENVRVRVRGWLEERNGPRMEVSRPEQIEFAEP